MTDILARFQALIDAQPLIWIGITIAAYALAQIIYRQAGTMALFNPTLLAVIIIIAILKTCGGEVHSYQHATASLSALLAPATVALAIVTFRSVAILQANAGVIICAVIAGGLAGSLAALAALKWLGGSDLALRSMVSHSTTTAVSVELTRVISGSISVAALVTLATGIFGAIVGPGLMQRCGLSDERIMGVALGVGSHALGTAKALEIGPTAGAFAAIGLSVNAVLTSIAVFTAAKLGFFVP